MPAPIPTFAEAPNGMLYVADGVKDPQYTNGRYAALRTSGLTAPTTTPAISGSSTGNIIGRFYAYVRFGDDLGNWSNLSPISSLYEPAAVAVDIDGATNATPIVITTSGAHGVSTGNKVLIQDVGGNIAANGLWTATVLTTTTLELDGSSGSGSFSGGGTITRGVGQIDYTSIQAPSDTKVTKKQILRNKDGDARVFYVDIETTSIATTSFTSTKTSDQLSDPVALTDSDENDNAVAIFGVIPDFKSILTHYKGRFFLTGDYDDSRGSVAVTNGSPTVTGHGTKFHANYVGRYLDIPGNTAKYTISAVTDETTLTISSNYAGTTDPYATYTIRDDDDERRTVYWSRANLPEAWGSGELRTLHEDPGSGLFKGVMPLNQWLFILAEYRIYRFHYVSDPALDSSFPPVGSRGVVNNRCWVLADGAGYLMDTLGIYVFDGNSIDSRIGEPVQELFRNTTLADIKIRWERRDSFHAVLEPNEGVIRWFVVMDGNESPHHALCLHYRSARWWVEEYSFPVTASCLGELNGKPQVFLATRPTRIVALEQGTLDGANPASGTVRGSVTSASYQSITDSGASFDTSLLGFPVSIVDGRGKGQERSIIAATATKLTVSQPWTVKPDTTSVYQVGGIRFRWRSLWFEQQESVRESWRAAHVQIQPTKNATNLDLRLYRDFSDTPGNLDGTRNQSENCGVGTEHGKPDYELQATKASGYFSQRFDGFRTPSADGTRFMSLELAGTTNQDPVIIRRLRLDGVAG
jgi:hypothetical protein